MIAKKRKKLYNKRISLQQIIIMQESTQVNQINPSNPSNPSNRLTLSSDDYTPEELLAFGNIGKGSKIHRSAMISAGAKIGENVHIDAYASISDCVEIGDETSIGKFTIVEGVTKIGRANKIGHHSLIGGAPQDMKYDNEPTELIIGDHNTIREFVTIHTGTKQGANCTKVGSYNWIMSYVHLAHDCILGDHIILSNNAQLAGHVEVESYAIVGGMSGVHQFVRIGAHSILGGASSLVQDLPPYVMAAGSKATPHGINQVGLGRRAFSSETIQALKQAYRIVYRESLTLEEAKQELKVLSAQNQGQAKEHLAAFLDFISKTERGIIRP
jgi:UDP-N-acetylglucosamine acyltransferase